LLFVVSKSTLLFLDIRDNYITDKGKSELGTALAASKVQYLSAVCDKWHLTEVTDRLDLSDQGMTSADMVLLAGALRKNQKLTHLDLSKNKLTHNLKGERGPEYKADMVGIIRLAGAIKTNQTLTSLNIKESNIGDKGKEYIGGCARESEHLRYLICDEWSIVEDTTELDVSDNSGGEKSFRSADATLLAGILKNNANVSWVNVLKNDIMGDGFGATKGFGAIEAVFEESVTLKSICGATGDTLDLSGQALGADDAKIIAVELRCTKMLKSLVLADTCNSLGVEGIKHIADTLSSEVRSRVVVMLQLFELSFYQIMCPCSYLL
jgi:hypothetical protein